jgi:hypothetical protein
MVKCISKKTIYKYFTIKNFIEESTASLHKEVHGNINIVNKKHNIHENFEIRKMFKDMFQSSDDSPIYQLKNITQKS